MDGESKYSVEKKGKKRVDSRTRCIALAGLILSGAFFIVGRLIANGQLMPTSVFGLCGFWQKYHLPCPACFMTRAVVLFCKGDIAGAFWLQPAGAVLCVIVLGVLICSFLTVLGVDLRFIYCRIEKLGFRYILLILLLIVLGGWVVTLARVLAQK